MKKIFITIIAFVSLTTAKAQSSSTPTASLSIVEVNSKGTVQPTYQGGKSYSQWVSEEKAKQAASKQATGVITMNANNNTGNGVEPLVSKVQQSSVKATGNFSGLPTSTVNQNKKTVEPKIEGTSADPKFVPKQDEPAKQPVLPTVQQTVQQKTDASLLPAAKLEPVTGKEIKPTDVKTAEMKTVPSGSSANKKSD